MFRTIPNHERVNLCFPETVLTSFNFLVEKRGFSCVKKDLTFVRYESSQVFINIYHGRASYELGVEVGLLVDSPDQKEKPFSIGEIIELRGIQKVTQPSFQASTREGVRRLVPQLAQLVERYAEQALDGNILFFEQLSSLRLEKSEEYLKELKLKHVRVKIDKAWHNKDFVKLLKLYESIQENLTPIELKKLAYARKHLKHE